jgi:hypothetical protein
MKTKRKVFWLLIGLLSLSLFTGISMAATEWWGKFGSTPESIVRNIASLANDNTATRVQDTKLDGITNKQGWSASPWSKYQISNTLIWLATSDNGITPYLQRIIYIGLVGASILLIWNGLCLVYPTIGWLDSRDPKKAKENIKYILIWVVLLTWFYAVITLVTAVINYFFGA